MIGSADVAPTSAAFRRGASSNAAEVPMNWRRDRFEQRRVYMAYVVTKPSLSLIRSLFKQENAASSARSASCRRHMTLLDSLPTTEEWGEAIPIRRSNLIEALSMNRPLTPSLSPSEGERVAGGRVRGAVHGSDARSRCAPRQGACV